MKTDKMFTIHTIPASVGTIAFDLRTREEKSHDKRRQRIRKVADTKSSPSTLIQKSFVFKLSTLESVFKKFRFRGSFYADTSVVVWTEGLTNNKVVCSNLSGIVWTGLKRVKRCLFFSLKKTPDSAI